MLRAVLGIIVNVHVLKTSLQRLGRHDGQSGQEDDSVWVWEEENWRRQ